MAACVRRYPQHQKQLHQKRSRSNVHICWLKGTASTQVTDLNTAQALGSGTLPVFATPAMAALMEQAAYTSLLPELEQGQGSVGTELSIRHLSATPVGMTVRADEHRDQGGRTHRHL